MDLGRGIKEGKERREERKDRKEFRDLQMKLEEEKLALSKSDSAANNEFRKEDLALRGEQVRNTAAYNQGMLGVQQGQLDQSAQRLQMEGERLAAEMRRSSLEEAIAKEKITSMRYDNQSAAGSLDAFDNITAMLAKESMDLDALSNQETAIKKLLDDAQTSNPNVVNTPNFKALTDELKFVMSQQQAIKDGHKLKLAIGTQLISNEKTADLGVRLLDTWGTQAKGGGPTMEVRRGVNDFGDDKQETVVRGNLEDMVNRGYNPPPVGTGMPGGNNPVAAPQSTPGQAAAASVFSNFPNLNRVGAK